MNVKVWMNAFNNEKSKILTFIFSMRHREPAHDSVLLLFSLETGLVRIFHAVHAVYLGRCRFSVFSQAWDIQYPVWHEEVLENASNFTRDGYKQTLRCSYIGFCLCVSLLQNLLPTATPQDAQQWLLRNRFSPFCRLFTNFSGNMALEYIKVKTPIHFSITCVTCDCHKKSLTEALVGSGHS